MFTAAIARAQVAFAFLLTKLQASRPSSRYRVSAVGARGVTMIEYAIMAAIALAIGYLFREQLGNAFSSILERINKGLGDTGLSS